ncbi:MAG: zf-HC2 domain-containing protein [Candidatus Krumholzibacteriota bacterium]|nr:zf-HC2 domain-containing protein [Candidatus Krumholzibacteriota bacterium]
MNCHLFKMLVQKYYDGELDLAGMAEYENHTSECRACHAIDREYSKVFNALGAMEIFEPSPEFNMKIMAHVNVARYRVSPLKKAWISVRGRWDLLPAPLRAGVMTSAVFGLFVAVYTPILTSFVVLTQRMLGIGASGIYMLRRTIEDPAILMQFINSLEKYRVAGRLLIKTFQRQAGDISAVYLSIGIIASILSLYLIIRMTRIAWRKGETHVGIF